jgi:hypothetical protein
MLNLKSICLSCFLVTSSLIGQHHFKKKTYKHHTHHNSHHGITHPLITNKKINHLTTEHSKYSTKIEERHPEDIHHQENKGVKSNQLRSNLKIIAAFFNNTYGLEFELPIKNNLSIGLNGMYYFAKQDNIENMKVNDPILRNGIRTELLTRFYFNKNFPIGLFSQAYIGYNNMLLHNGFTKPYSLIIRKKEDKEDLREVNDFAEPTPLCFGVGLGYQLYVVPQKIIALGMLGIDMSKDKQNRNIIFPFIYPTIGYVF